MQAVPAGDQSMAGCRKGRIMVKSMTGFGRAEISNDRHKMLVEMKAVNHRYLDFSIKLPRRLNLFESRIRNVIKEYAERGKLDIYVSYENFIGGEGSLTYHADLAGLYMHYLEQMSREFGIENRVTTMDLARLPEVLSMEQEEEEEEELWQLLEQALRSAAEHFVEQRSREGEQLRTDLLQKLSGMEEDVAQIEAHSPEVVQNYRVKLEDKIRELLDSANVDEARLMMEVALFADKICVDEETVRLRSHISGMRSALEAESGQSVGRKLDFIAQEMNREANTILSKCNNMDISGIAIRLKTEIEKIREQVQNIE